MSKKAAAMATSLVDTQDEVMDPNTVYAYIVKDDDGNYHVEALDGTVGPTCKLVDEGDRTIALTPNKSNRKWYNRKKADELIASSGKCPLYYKESKHFGSTGTTHLPNEKLIAYLSADEQAEYKAIINRAIAAREAERNRPLTEEEKLRKQIASYEATIAKLKAKQNLAAAAATSSDSTNFVEKEEN